MRNALYVLLLGCTSTVYTSTVIDASMDAIPDMVQTRTADLAEPVDLARTTADMAPACGKVGEPCCAIPAAPCESTQWAQVVCDGTPGTCQTCGTLHNICCAGNTCSYTNGATCHQSGNTTECF
jgi:hypothetical protein